MKRRAPRTVDNHSDENDVSEDNLESGRWGGNNISSCCFLARGYNGASNYFVRLLSAKYKEEKK